MNVKRSRSLLYLGAVSRSLRWLSSRQLRIGAVILVVFAIASATGFWVTLIAWLWSNEPPYLVAWVSSIVAALLLSIAANSFWQVAKLRDTEGVRK